MQGAASSMQCLPSAATPTVLQKHQCKFPAACWYCSLLQASVVYSSAVAELESAGSSLSNMAVGFKLEDATSRRSTAAPPSPLVLAGEAGQQQPAWLGCALQPLEQWCVCKIQWNGGSRGLEYGVHAAAAAAVDRQAAFSTGGVWFLLQCATRGCCKLFCQIC